MNADATTVLVHDWGVPDTPSSGTEIPGFSTENFIGKFSDYLMETPASNAPAFHCPAPGKFMELNAEAVETAEINTASHWYAKWIMQITALQRLATSYDGYGTLPPNSIAAVQAKDALQELAELDFEPNAIDPSSDEGICISFRRGNRYADIECFNSGEVLAATRIDGEEPIIWELDPRSISGDIAKINRFILG